MLESRLARRASVSGICNAVRPFSGVLLVIGAMNMTCWPAAFVEELADAFLERPGFDPGASLITAGVSGGLMLGYLALLNPGDKVLLPAPYWVSYDGLIRQAGAVPEVIATNVGNDFKSSLIVFPRPSSGWAADPDQ